MKSLLMAAALLMLAPPVAAQDTPLGRWVTESGRARVLIEPCGEALCGRIVWLAEPLNEAGQPRADRNNPDPTLRDRPILGLPILQGFKPGREPGRWEDGKIYNPEDGKTYSCTLTLQDADTLRVRGYVGLPMLGQTQVWKRARPEA